MVYDKTRFINNVYELTKQQKLKIGELETACGVSVGYFARLRQGDKNAASNADLLVKLANRLSVSVDSLLSFDFTQATGSEQKLQNYMDKLIRETETHRLVWQRDLSGNSHPLPMNPNGTSAHPLFSAKEILVSDDDKAEDDFPGSAHLSMIVYHSLFRPDQDDLSAPEIYRCSFPHERTLYLAVVVKPGPIESVPALWTELELLMTEEGLSSPVPFAHTDHEQPGCLDKTLIHLLDTVKGAITPSKLSPKACAMIDDYLAH